MFYVFVQRKTNVPGIIILSIALTDIIHSLSYLLVSLKLLDLFEFNLTKMNFLYYHTIFRYETITSTLLAIILALNTLSVVFFTRILFTEQYKYFIVVVCFILPIAIYFFPVAAVMQKGLFDLEVAPDLSPFQKNFDRVYFIILLFLLVLAVIGSYVMVWYKFKMNLRVNVKPGKNLDIKAVGLKFIWAYSISILLCNIPLLINDLFELNQWLPESMGLFFLYVVNLFNPLRGYMHALAVLIIYVSRVPNRDLSIKIILCRVLLFEYKIDEMPEENKENPGAVITIDSLNWDVSSMRYSSDNRSAEKPAPVVRVDSLNWTMSNMWYDSDNVS